MPATLIDEGNTVTVVGTVGWTATTGPYGPWFDPTEWIGLTYDFGATLDAGTGLRIDPAAVQSLQLSITAIGAAAEVLTTQVRYVSSRGTTDWGTLSADSTWIYAPGSEDANSEVVETTLIAQYDHTFGAGDETLTFDLLPVDNTTWTDAHKALFGYMQSAGFDGQLQLGIEWTEAPAASLPNVYGSAGATPPVLVVGTEVPFHTGFMGDRSRTRAVHDPRSGMPLYSADAVEDAYVEGLWLSPDEWDPEDSDIHPPEFPDSEGEVDDEKSF